MDGAVLLKELGYKKQTSKFKYTLIPHWTSEYKYDWKSLCEELNIYYISPLAPYDEVIRVISQSEVVLAEAMHGAIVADTLRVPWIPLKAYDKINDFKWRDWCSSLNIEYSPINLPSLYGFNEFTKNKVGHKFPGIPNLFCDAGLKAFQLLQKYHVSKAMKILESLKKSRSYLSDNCIVEDKSHKLLELVYQVQSKYS